MISIGSVMIFAAGFIVGVLFALIVRHFEISIWVRQAKNLEEQNKKQDPADWWKNGGSPPDCYYGYDEDAGAAP